MELAAAKDSEQIKSLEEALKVSCLQFKYGANLDVYQRAYQLIIFLGGVRKLKKKYIWYLQRGIGHSKIFRVLWLALRKNLRKGIYIFRL